MLIHGHGINQSTILILILGSVFPMVLHPVCLQCITLWIVTLVLQIEFSILDSFKAFPSLPERWWRSSNWKPFTDSAREGKLVFIFPYVCMSSIQLFFVFSFDLCIITLNLHIYSVTESETTLQWKSMRLCMTSAAVLFFSSPTPYSDFVGSGLSQRLGTARMPTLPWMWKQGDWKWPEWLIRNVGNRVWGYSSA